ncbi:RagB/SusD family nutrient uptake outer membrane protein, partial [Mucilaginibacter sp.]|uniref:RagB/SusD family nutrient uptake outer membrane protein n=1 Tax=Mucilaginibacter sp. TaxID=1882438 RepID=UPI0026060956
MKQIKIVLLMVILTGLCSCRKNLLTVQPTNLLTADQIVSNDASITAYFASLYRDIPMEDFNFVKGIFYTFPDGGGRYLANYDDEALNGFNLDSKPLIGDNASANNTIYDEIYKAIRNVNTFIQLVSATNNFPAPQQAQYIAEAKFIRAYYYYGLVKYYGGVPLVLDIPATPIPLPRNKE